MIDKWIVTVFMILTILSCDTANERMFRKSSLIMDTSVTITAVSDSRGKAEDAIDHAFDEIRRIEKLLSFWSGESEIAAINVNAGQKSVEVSAMTLDIIEKSIHISDKTGGAFDATIGPVIRLWDFKTKTRPDRDTVKKTLGLINYRLMEINREESTAFLRGQGMSFDTGGIAKGFAADAAVEALKHKGIEAALVSIAGDIKAYGLKPGKNGAMTPWRVGIRDPRPEGGKELIATIDLTDEAVSTSGDYERFFMEDGVRYHHLLDPGTGYPAVGCSSVTVIAKDAVYTDGFSTGIFVLGPKKGLKALEMAGIDGIIISSDGRRYVSEGMKSRVRWLR
jgi:thiamine biosynthesis lipoprotein